MTTAATQPHMEYGIILRLSIVNQLTLRTFIFIVQSQNMWINRQLVAMLEKNSSPRFHCTMRRTIFPVEKHFVLHSLPVIEHWSVWTWTWIDSRLMSFNGCLCVSVYREQILCHTMIYCSVYSIPHVWRRLIPDDRPTNIGSCCVCVTLYLHIHEAKICVVLIAF